MNPMPRLVERLRAAGAAAKQERLGKFGLLRIISYITLGCAALGIGVSLVFVYRHVFESISAVQTIILLKNDMEDEAVDLDRLERVKSAWEKRRAALDLSLARNPFAPAPTTTKK